jgi:hypothetical protein
MQIWNVECCNYKRANAQTVKRHVNACWSRIVSSEVVSDPWRLASEVSSRGSAARGVVWADVSVLGPRSWSRGAACKMTKRGALNFEARN